LSICVQPKKQTGICMHSIATANNDTRLQAVHGTSSHYAQRPCHSAPGLGSCRVFGHGVVKSSTSAPFSIARYCATGKCVTLTVRSPALKLISGPCSTSDLSTYVCTPVHRRGRQHGRAKPSQTKDPQ